MRKERSRPRPLHLALLGSFVVLAHTTVLHRLVDPTPHDVIPPRVNAALAVATLVLAMGLLGAGAVLGLRRGDTRPLLIAGTGGFLAMTLAVVALRDADAYLGVLAGIFASLVIAAAAMRPDALAPTRRGDAPRTRAGAARSRWRARGRRYPSRLFAKSMSERPAFTRTRPVR